MLKWRNMLVSILRPLLDTIYWIVPNYGWAVVIFTVPSPRAAFAA